MAQTLMTQTVIHGDARLGPPPRLMSSIKRDWHLSASAIRACGLAFSGQKCPIKRSRDFADQDGRIRDDLSHGDESMDLAAEAAGPHAHTGRPKTFEIGLALIMQRIKAGRCDKSGSHSFEIGGE